MNGPPPTIRFQKKYDHKVEHQLSENKWNENEMDRIKMPPAATKIDLSEMKWTEQNPTTGGSATGKSLPFFLYIYYLVRITRLMRTIFWVRTRTFCFFVPTPYPVCADLQFQHLRIDRSIDDFYYTRSLILSGGNIVAKKRVILKNIPALAAMGRAALSSGAARCSSILPFTVAWSPRLCPGTSRALPGDMLLCFYALTP